MHRVSSYNVYINQQDAQNSCDYTLFFYYILYMFRTQILCSKYGRAEQATENNRIRCMRIACCLPKATNTHSECIILIDFPQQKWLPERASILRCTYISCHVNLSDICRLSLNRRYSPASVWEVDRVG